MPTTDRDPRQSTLFSAPRDRRPAALDMTVAARDARNAVFARWGEDMGRAMLRHAPRPRWAGKRVGA